MPRHPYSSGSSETLAVCPLLQDKDGGGGECQAPCGQSSSESSTCLKGNGHGTVRGRFNAIHPRQVTGLKRLPGVD